MGKKQATLFAAMVLGYSGFYLVRNNLYLLIPLLLTEGFERTKLSDIAALTATVYGLSKWIMGKVVDCLQWSYMLPASLLLTATIAISFQWYPFPFQTNMGLVIRLILLSGCGAIGFPTCIQMLVTYFQKGVRGWTLALWSVSHHFGGMISPLLVYWSLRSCGDRWQAGFYLPGYCAAGLALFLLIMIKATISSTTISSIQPKPKRHFCSDRKLHLWKSFSIWKIGVLNGLLQWIRFGFLDWIPSYLHEVKGLSVGMSGFSHTLFAIGGALGGLWSGWLVDRTRSAQSAFQSMGTKMALTGWLCCAFLLPICQFFITGSTLTFFTLFLLGCSLYALVIPADLLLLQLVPKNQAATALGFMGLISYLSSSIAATTLLGRILARWSWQGVWLVLETAMLCVFLLAIYIFHTSSTKLHADHPLS